MPRAIFSPTTEPMEPPDEVKIHAGDHRLLPSILPTAVSMASLRPVPAITCFTRSVYFLLSVNCSGSPEMMLGLSSLYLLSSKIRQNTLRNRCGHGGRNSGIRYKFSACSSVREMCLHEGHLYHKPSRVFFFSSVEVKIPLLIRLNHDTL